MGTVYIKTDPIYAQNESSSDFKRIQLKTQTGFKRIGKRKQTDPVKDLKRNYNFKFPGIGDLTDWIDELSGLAAA